MTDDFITCECGKKVYNDPGAKIEGDLYQCLGCYKFPAVELNGKVVSIQEIYDVNKQRDKIHEWEYVDEELSLVNVEIQFEKKILLSILANRDVFTGFSGYTNEYKAVLLVNKNEFLGCIVWCKGEYARLNLIFLRKEFRKKGHGAKFLKAWVEKIADEINDRYEVESPNKAFGSLLFKLGHLRMDNDKIVEEKCILISSAGWESNDVV